MKNLNIVVKKLIKKKITVSVAESCTGGLLTHNLTKLANSSKYFQMGLTTYSNQAKINILKVNRKIIQKYGAVSSECCKAMAQNLSKISITPQLQNAIKILFKLDSIIQPDDAADAVGLANMGGLNGNILEN